MSRKLEQQAALALLSSLTFSIFLPMKAHASEHACVDVVVYGAAWAGGNGVDAHSNGNDQGTGSSYAGNEVGKSGEILSLF